MPHLSIEYSANLEARVDISGLCEALRQAAAEIETFPLAGLRVRALVTCVLCVWRRGRETATPQKTARSGNNHRAD